MEDLVLGYCHQKSRSEIQINPRAVAITASESARMTIKRSPAGASLREEAVRTALSSIDIEAGWRSIVFAKRG
jgi:hypothetical protein